MAVVGEGAKEAAKTYLGAKVAQAAVGIGLPILCKAKALLKGLKNGLKPAEALTKDPGLMSLTEDAAKSATQLEFQFAPQVEQYALRATESGFYPVMIRGSENAQYITYLEKGDVWKFGTTVNPGTRYSATYLQSIGEHGVQYSTEFLGTEPQAIQLQNMKIQNYRLQSGRLPPGNKVVN